MDPTAYIVVNMDQGELGTPLPLVYRHEMLAPAIIQDCEKLLDGNKQALEMLDAMSNYITMVLDIASYPTTIDLGVACYAVQEVDLPC